MPDSTYPKPGPHEFSAEDEKAMRDNGWETPMTNREKIQARNRRLGTMDPVSKVVQWGRELPQAMKEAGAAGREAGKVREPIGLSDD